MVIYGIINCVVVMVIITIKCTWHLIARASVYIFSNVFSIAKNIRNDSRGIHGQIVGRQGRLDTWFAGFCFAGELTPIKQSKVCFLVHIQCERRKCEYVYVHT